MWSYVIYHISHITYHIIISSYHHIIISSYHHIIISIISSYHIIISSYHHIIISYHIIISQHHIITSSYHHTSVHRGVLCWNSCFPALVDSFGGCLNQTNTWASYKEHRPKPHARSQVFPSSLELVIQLNCSNLNRNSLLDSVWGSVWHQKCPSKHPQNPGTKRRLEILQPSIHGIKG